METKLKDSITDATVFYFIHGGATVLKKHSGVAYDVFQFRFHRHKRVDFKGLGGPSLPGPWVSSHSPCFDFLFLAQLEAKKGCQMANGKKFTF